MIVKRVKNVRLTNNKVSGRYNYITHEKKANWIYENTFDRFDFAVKKRFKDKQDTTHFVASFSRVLTEEEKLKAREIIANFFQEKFGDEYFLSIAEHNDTDQTHYHILISRNIITSKMLSTSLKGNKYKELIVELKKRVEDAGLSNEKEKKINRKYEQSNEFVKGFGYFEYRNYKELQEGLKYLSTKEKAETILSLLPFATDKLDSYKAMARIISELVSELLNKNELTTLNDFMREAGIKIFLEKTLKGRERIKIEFTKKWKFLENAKTTKFTIKNLNKEVSLELKQILKEFENGITRIDKYISREIGELERQIQSDRGRNTAIRTEEEELRTRDRNQTDKVRAIRRRIDELSARIREFKARDISDRTGKTGKAIGVREVKQGIKTTGKVIKYIAREFEQIAECYINFRRREREIIARSLQYEKDKYSTREYTEFRELERRLEEYTTHITRAKSQVSKVSKRIGEFRFRSISELEKRFSNIQKRFKRISNGYRNGDRQDIKGKFDITRAISELERELSELATELERARETAERVKQKATRRNREDTKSASQDNNRNRRTQELSNINNDNSSTTGSADVALHAGNNNQKNVINNNDIGEEEMISLEFAKKNINLVEFAVNRFGYEILEEKSSENYTTLRKIEKNGKDVIVVRKNENGHWIYFNTDTDKAEKEKAIGEIRLKGDKGTVVEFIQYRTGKNLGYVRKFLSEYLQDRKAGKVKKIEEITTRTGTGQSKGKSINQILKEYAMLKEISDKNYLTELRKISKETLENIAVFQDEKNNVVFPLVAEQGQIIGLAKYNKDFKQIVGKKGIWLSIQDYDYEKMLNSFKNILNIVITESPIDGLSYLELEDIKARNGEAGALRKENTFMLSTQGQIGKNTIDYVYSYVKAINQLSAQKVFITLAFDNDAKGQEMSIIMKNQLNKRLKEDNIDMKIIIEKPANKDWNEDLVKEKEENISIQIDLSPNKSPNRLPKR